MNLFQVKKKYFCYSCTPVIFRWKFLHVITTFCASLNCLYEIYYGDNVERKVGTLNFLQQKLMLIISFNVTTIF